MNPPPASLQGRNGAWTMKSLTSSGGFAPLTCWMQSGAESMISGIPLLPRLVFQDCLEAAHGLGLLAQATLLAHRPPAEDRDRRHEDCRAGDEREHGLRHRFLRRWRRRRRWRTTPEVERHEALVLLRQDRLGRDG